MKITLTKVMNENDLMINDKSDPLQVRYLVETSFMCPNLYIFADFGVTEEPPFLVY
jgi:hypothetical protein